ncbi:MAG: carboxynorspermidine decarboxylase [Planctomycetia bacterium]|nr:carboxynorspermidine decarboxylase [Planctomycetia bacterium]
MMNPIYVYPNFDYTALPASTPYYITDRALLRRNMEIMQEVQERAKCKILLALKAFSTWNFFDDMIPCLAGASASSIYEAQLGAETFGPGKELHVYSPAYTEMEIRELCKLADHIVFNSITQWLKFKEIVKNADHKIEVGLRINPEYSEVRKEIYNPCTNRSRFGVSAETLVDAGPDALDGIDGFHFHTMCQQGSEVLGRTLEVFCDRFDKYFHRIKWVNFGGGHDITRMGYDVNRLCSIIHDFQDKYNLDVYLEPGEAHVLHTGFLVATVLDVIENPNGNDVVILDTSATAHMPDVLEMPYTPEIRGARRQSEDVDGPLEEGGFKYILGSKTCLSGDVIGEYLFDTPLKVGDRITLEDMSQYTVCKNTMFNGVQLPSIASCDSDQENGDYHLIREFNYEDFKGRLS